MSLLFSLLNFIKNTSCCYIFLFFFIFVVIEANAQTIPPKERICGKWESASKNLRILVYLDGDQFKAKLIWFSNTENKPMDYWTDVNNPDPSRRKRKLLGMNILENLTYNSLTNSWENGLVYDSRNGRIWNASAYIGKNGRLHVRGYWHFKFIGRTMNFFRIL